MILYKYYPDNANSFKSVSVRGLWCHHPKNMNDPFECLWNVNRSFKNDQLLEFLEIMTQRNDPRFQKITELKELGGIFLANEYRKKLLSEFAFCALSESFDNILMWSHYSSGHTGFVIGFEFDNINPDFHLTKVNYVDTIPQYDLKELIKIIDGDYSSLVYTFRDLSVKAHCWEYEKEWRFWIQKPGYYYYKPTEVKEIFFGVSCKKETQLLVAQLTSQYLPNDFNYKIIEFRDKPIRLSY